jgi:uncharacterized membrane protein YdjX (TVP38/TMEM64 family)
VDKRVVIIVVVIVIAGAFFAFDLGRFLTLDYLQGVRSSVVGEVEAAPIVASLIFFGGYVVVTGLSLPGAAVMTLAAGAIFGLWWGLVLASFASSVGATVAFLIARSVLRDWVQSRFGAYLEPINRGFEADGNFYLFSLRMVPVFPFFIINLLMGLTPMRAVPFYLVSQVGMAPATAVFVFAGTQLAAVTSLGDVLSPGLILALSLVGLFPLLARRLMSVIKRRREAAAT